MSVIFNGKDSLNDFNIFVATKEIPAPIRKTVTDSVPYMSGLWDFSTNEYEAIILKYSFDVIAENKRDLNAQKTRILAWLNGKGKELFDTDISLDYHYEVYFVKTSWSEDGLQALLTAEFTCYPFLKSADISSVNTLTSTQKTITVKNNGAREVWTSVTVSTAAQITVGDSVYSFSAGTFDYAFKLSAGSNILKIKGSGNLKITYKEEIF